MHTIVYHQTRSVGRNDEETAHRTGMLRWNADTQTLQAWQAWLEIKGSASQRAVEAVLPSVKLGY